MIDGAYWMPVKDGDPRASWLYRRHYSYRPYKDGRQNLHGYANRFLIVGPGEKLVLLGIDCQALCCWRRFHDASSKGLKRVYCTVFRNEGNQKASHILREAQVMAQIKWPGETLYTYVNADKVESEVPGYCFRRAGWRHVGETANGLMLFALKPKKEAVC